MFSSYIYHKRSHAAVKHLRLHLVEGSNMSLANAFLLLLTLTCVLGTPMSPILAGENVNMTERHVQGLENNDIWPILLLKLVKLEQTVEDISERLEGMFNQYFALLRRNKRVFYFVLVVQQHGRKQWVGSFQLKHLKCTFWMSLYFTSTYFMSIKEKKAKITYCWWKRCTFCTFGLLVCFVNSFWKIWRNRKRLKSGGWGGGGGGGRGNRVGRDTLNKHN